MSTTTKADELREELIHVLEHDQLDYAKVQQVSSELARLEPDAVRFSVDAGLISRLGRELVARQETAVAELVKNAYDADARQVTLIFSEADVPGGRLEIRDDGLGMTREQLIDGFMRLSSSEKIEQPTSLRYKRQRAGRKGIGRFAVQRLGNKLTIRTQTKDLPTALEIVVDWDAFAVGLDLSAVTSRIRELPKKQREEGTTLLISGLREAWDERAIKQVYRYVSDLLQPFPLSEVRALRRSDPGFKVSLYREHEGEISLVADEETEIFSYALAEIEGYVDAKGQGYWSVRSDKLKLNDSTIAMGKQPEKHTEPFRALRNVEFRAYYFIYLTEFIPRSLNKTIRELAERKGGIRVYRNGFRVSPYGDPDDDWLGLDARYSRRSRNLLEPIGNRNFFGFAELVDSEGERFEETSSREGLIENAAFEELQDFISRVLIAAALRVAEARRTGQTTKAEPEESPGVVVTQAYKSLDKTAKELVRAGQTEQAKALRQVSRQLQAAVATQTGRTETLLEELSMLRVLASLGQTIGEFTHEVRQSLNPAQADANWLREQLALGTPEQTAAERLSLNIKGFKTYASYFDRAVVDNASRIIEPQDLQQVIRQFLEVMNSAAARSGIKMDMEILAYDLYTRPMHASEWTSVLFNFFTNARKAVDRAGVKGKILLRAGQENGRVFLEFADNGDGIAPANEDRIFNAFFTTSSPASHRASEVDEAQGTGLGLKIVHDIASSYGGNVFLVSPPEGYTTCFRLEVPAASQADLEAYDV